MGVEQPNRTATMLSGALEPRQGSRPLESRVWTNSHLEPGTCPIPGSALVKVGITLEAGVSLGALPIYRFGTEVINCSNRAVP